MTNSKEPLVDSKRAPRGHSLRAPLAILALACFAPLALEMIGVDWSSHIDVNPAHAPTEQMFQTLRGSFTHTILEWTAVCAAVFVVMLTYVNFRMTRIATGPVIGIALLCAGGMDAFHTFAADRLIEATADNKDLIPFTWAISRLFNGLILLLGVGICIVAPKRMSFRRSSLLIASVAAGFVLVAYLTIQYCAVSASLPQTMFPESVIKRPYDIAPLIPYLLLGLVVIPMYLRRNPSIFLRWLQLSMIPAGAVQLYMAFGSDQLHDSAFNIAHGLKAFSYTLPAIGLMREHVGLHDEIRRKNREIQKARDVAARADQMKSEFLANMSHEIRTPMTAILGFNEMLRDDDLEIARRGECMEAVQRNGEHLLALINDILDLSRVEAGEIDLEHAPCDPTEITRSVIAQVGLSAGARDIGLTLDIDPQTPRQIISDPTRLQQVVLNLVSNAVKFTEVGAVHVRLSGRPAPKDGGMAELIIEVEDTGIGMEPDQIERLFQPFQQADSTTTRRYGGTGLGLAISKHIIDESGGSIRVWSERGIGSRFTVTLPYEPADPVSAPSQQQTASGPGSVTNLHGRILVAEDGPDNQILINHLLKKAGADVEIVENGRLAVDAALQNIAVNEPFDLIIMDMMMPVLDGYDATAELRARGYTGPIMALTASAMTSDQQRCIEAGCDRFCAKPIKREVFISACAELMGAETIAPD